MVQDLRLLSDILLDWKIWAKAEVKTALQLNVTMAQFLIQLHRFGLTDIHQVQKQHPCICTHICIYIFLRTVFIPGFFSKEHLHQKETVTLHQVKVHHSGYL